MRKNLTALWKDYLLGIVKSKSRFFSIMILLALGVFILVGLTVTGPIMRTSMERKLQAANHQDITVDNPMGLLKEDRDLIRQMEGLRAYEWTYDLDLVSQRDNLQINIQSLPRDIGQLEWLEGRPPQEGGQVALGQEMKAYGYQLGDRIRFNKEKNPMAGPDDKDGLRTYSYEIVAFVQSTEYTSEDHLGFSANGGSLKGYGYILSEDFLLEDPTRAKLLFKDLEGLATYSQAYKDRVGRHGALLEEAFSGRAEDRLEDLDIELRGDIEEGKTHLEDARELLAEGRKKLSRAREDLLAGESDFKKGQSSLMKALLEGQRDLDKGKKKLEAASSDLKKGEKDLAQGQADLAQGKETLAQEESHFLKGKEDYHKGVDDYIAGLLEVDKNKKDYEEGLRLLGEGKEKLLEAEKDLDKGQREIDQGRKTLASQRARLESEKKKLEEGAQALARGKAQLEEKRAQLETAKAGLREAQAGLERAQAARAQLDESVSQLQGKKAQLEGAISQKESQLASLRAQLETAPEEEKEGLRAQISGLEAEVSGLRASLTQVEQGIQEAQAARDQYAPGLDAQIADLRATISQIQAQVDQGQAALEGAQATLEAKEKELKEGQALIQEAFKKLEAGEADLARGQAELDRGRRDLEAGKKEILDKQAQLETAKKALEKAEKDLEGGRAELEEAKKKVDQGEKDLAQAEDKVKKGADKLAQGRADYEEGLKDYQKGKRDLAQAKKEGQNKLDQAQKDLKEGWADYEEGLADFQGKEPEALDEIKEGQRDLNRAQDILTILEEPAYQVTPRQEEGPIFQYFDYASRVDNLAMIFPIFFFAIALLLSSTTMNRLVDEERVQIGTYKALGYSQRAIAMKYILFGALSALIGGILGIIGGNTLLAYLITEAYSIGYHVQPFAMEFYPLQAFLGLLAALLSTSLVAYVSVHRSLKENVASLMRPKAPKQGTRILLERIGPLWRRMSFLKKVTARNIFRYKKRMVMTILGAVGSVALLLLGFGIQTAVDGLAYKQYEELTPYDDIIIYEKLLDREDYLDYRDQLLFDDRISASGNVRLESLSVPYDKGLDQRVSLVVPTEKEELKGLVTLRDRRTQKVFDLKEGDIVITEKLAKIKKVQPGDRLAVEDDRGQRFNLQVSHITEGYAGHYMYMLPETYQEVFGKDFKDNADLIRVAQGYQDQVDKILADYNDFDVVLATVTLDQFKSMLDQMTRSISLIVMVIVLASTLLSMVVLYSLTDINIHERKRELSTIKVLGFYPKELTAYVYRETGSLTLMGVLMGLGVGKLLHYGVLQVVVPDIAMLDPELEAWNYLVPMAMTLSISLVVMVLVHRRLKHIDMVEALKAIE
ncbi:MAG: FtsX-like permease family protein [Tissierellia bacterium]|nr:FtsX-like permease family protein [Tissierellia bacterium]